MVHAVTSGGIMLDITSSIKAEVKPKIDYYILCTYSCGLSLHELILSFQSIYTYLACYTPLYHHISTGYGPWLPILGVSLILLIWDIFIHSSSTHPMSTQQTDAEFNETLDYEEPVEQEPEPVSNTDLTVTHYSSVPQPWQPTILQPSIAVQEPVVWSPYTPSASLTLAAQSKLMDVNLGGLSMCKIDLLKAGNWISWKTRIHNFFQLFEISNVVHSVEPMPENPILAWK